MSTNTDKHIKIKGPVPEKIKKAIESKKEWIRKVQAGELEISKDGIRKRVL